MCVDFDGGPTGFVADEHLRGDAGGARRGGGGCYITTAAVTALGQPDDGLLLSTLRALRDEHMSSTPAGRAAVAAYYELAPRLVAELEVRPDRDALYRSLTEQFLLPAMTHVLRGDPSRAAALYEDMVRSVTRSLRG